MVSLFILLQTSILACLIKSAETVAKDLGHVVIITSPFFGHIIPLLDLAKRLSLQHHVSFVISAAKLDVLKRRGYLEDEYQNQNVTSLHPSRLKFIGLFDGNINDIEVSRLV